VGLSWILGLVEQATMKSMAERMAKVWSVFMAGELAVKRS